MEKLTKHELWALDNLVVSYFNHPTPDLFTKKEWDEHQKAIWDILKKIGRVNDAIIETTNKSSEGAG